MRKFILPILVAGAIAFTAAQAMATDAQRSAGFAENHAFGSTYGAGTETVIEADTSGGNHYKKTDMLENGRHGGDSGGYQLSSSMLKSVAMDSIPGWTAADGAYGYTSNANPFQAGALDTDFPMVAPRYSQPCPDWLGVKGDCEANTYATDPQTEDAENIWDGTVLDDLYQTVGAQDSRTIIATASTTGEETFRTFDQNLDDLFYNGKRGTATIGTTTNNGAFTKRHFNIQDTLDQDLADWSTSYAASVGGNVVKDETTGIYGKLTQIFQLAGIASSVEGCASGGAQGMSDSNAANPCSSYQTGTLVNEGVNVGEGGGSANFQTDDFSAWVIDQWVISDVYDWTHTNDDTLTNDKNAGVGIKQGYSSWFRDGSQKNIDYTYVYEGGHGTINKSVDLGTNHQHPDP